MTAAALNGHGIRARKAITSSNTASSAYAIDNPRISFCSSISVATVSPLAQRLQQRLLVTVDVLNCAAAIDREADGGTLGSRAFEHHRVVINHLDGRVQLFHLHRDRHGVAAHCDT